ncbi:hypothetical protein T08_12415, partial [Trichinella sp. T8]
MIVIVAYIVNIIHHTSLIVRVAISAFGEYFCRVLFELHPHCRVAYHKLRITLVLQIFSESNYVEIYMNEIVDKYVITKHYHQLMPLSLATYFKIFHLSL